MAIFDNAIYRLEEIGFVTVILPFVLIFTILFAILEKIQLFGTKGKRFNLVIALAISLGVVIPHVTGGYGSLGYDPIDIINGILPGTSLIIVVVVTVAIVIGMLGIDVSKGLLGGRSMVGTIISIIALLALGAVIVYNVWPAALPIEITSWLQDESTQAVIAMIAIFGLVIWYVTSSGEDASDETKAKARRDKFYENWFGIAPPSSKPPTT